MSQSSNTAVLFVCLGNICRSPTAEGVFRQLIAKQGIADQFTVDSAGTGDWHIGHPPDARAQEAARRHGYDISELRARRVSVQDFHDFDHIIAMDQQNLVDLKAMQPTGSRAEVSKLLDYRALKQGQKKESNVPDPYYGGESGFDEVIALVTAGCEGLLNQIR